jgi:hypothetical protein
MVIRPRPERLFRQHESRKAYPMTDVEMRIRCLRPPCPNCEHQEYRYGFNFLSFIAESANAVPAIIRDGLDPKTIGLIIAGAGSGLGVFSMPRVIYNVATGVQEMPLLLCEHCRNFVIVCPSCATALLLKEEPGTGALIECQHCKKRFSHCEV